MGGVWWHLLKRDEDPGPREEGGTWGVEVYLTKGYVYLYYQ